MLSERQRRWRETNRLTSSRLVLARKVLQEIHEGREVMSALRQHPLEGGGYLTKAALVAAYQQMVAAGVVNVDAPLLERIRMKPVRTLSGVTTVTVLTKPYPCPGKCIFCPTDVRMPKSYLPDEPGAMRALEHDFDPYAQVHARLHALRSLGHPVDKIELLILGGTWSAYRRDYQEWFVARCFDAMNEFEIEPAGPMPGAAGSTPGDGTGLAEQHSRNESAGSRNVGLVIETRPDEITPDELRWLRQLGVTKVQLGAQSLDDRILDLNQRGHDVACTRRAVSLLRAAGFKIVLHWMPNLLGASIESDHVDFGRLWAGMCPDEIKIYPNQLLANAELYEVWKRGEFTPYTTHELIGLLADLKPTIPRYCRVNRIIRDIPSTNVVEGNRRTSLRLDVHAELQRRGARCQCVRCREVRDIPVESEQLFFDDLIYSADHAEEHFLSFNTPQDGIAGFARLSLPTRQSSSTQMEELKGAAMIREVHVYGQSLAVGAERAGAAQHSGLGTRLLAQAETIAAGLGFSRLAVISAVGTRQYYLERGYERGDLYLLKSLRR